MRRVAYIALLCAAVARPVFGETLADIRSDIAILQADLNALNLELVASQSTLELPDGTLIDRAAAIEMELQRVTNHIERLEFRIQRVVKDGTSRIAQLENRLCALETNCVENSALVSALGADEQLGTNTVEPPTTGVIMTVTEQREFDVAKQALENGDPATAIALFSDFTSAYPGGPITQEAFFLMGQAETELEDFKAAARAYLNAYSTAPDSSLAADAMFQMSLSFERIGRTKEACLTLAEVGGRFPSSAAASAALSAMEDLGCS